MKYWYDTEFIENGVTIDLISIGIVAEDGRELYLQNRGCVFENASDWVARNVFVHLLNFDMAKFIPNGSSPGADIHKENWSQTPWRQRYELESELKAFCDPEKYGKPEFWGYYSAYDHVALCQIFGTMMHLPKGWPMYTRDIKQLCDSLGNPQLPEQGKGEHHALADARWNKQAFEFLQSLSQ